MKIPLHLMRLNPISQRAVKGPLDKWGFLAWLFDAPVILFWIMWSLHSIFRRPAFGYDFFTSRYANHHLLYVFYLGFPLAGLIFGLLSIDRHHRKSDPGVIAAFLSLVLLAAGILFYFLCEPLF